MSRSKVLFVVTLLSSLLIAPLHHACAQESKTPPGKAGTQMPGEAVTQQLMPGSIAGYLASTALPNSLALIPPPPVPGSAAFAADEEASKKSLALRGTPRWTMATEDASLAFPQAASTFSCALNAPITERDTPRLYLLMRRVLDNPGHATGAAKDHYQRARPFALNMQPICTPADENALRNNGSYPSGHASIGWAWALILSEIAPEKMDAILARGRAFGESRVICNVHWQSDVIEGAFVGAATVARLHADPAFLADLQAAKAELAAVRAKGLKPVRDCTAETKALAQ
jgi:acid phosphatase (class A)